MRKSAFLLAFSLALLGGCVTINVYFPAAAAQQAADKVIGNIIGPDSSGPSPAPSSSTPPPSSGSSSQPEPLSVRVLNAVIPAAYAAESQPNLDIRTPAIQAIEVRMRDRSIRS